MNTKVIILFVALFVSYPYMTAKSSVTSSPHSSWLHFPWNESSPMVGARKTISKEYPIKNTVSTINAFGSVSIDIHHVDTIEQQRMVVTTHENLFQYFEPQITSSSLFSREKILSVGVRPHREELTYEVAKYELFLNLTHIKTIKAKSNVSLVITDAIVGDSVSIRLEDGSTAKISTAVEHLDVHSTNRSSLELSVSEGAQNVKVLSEDNSKVTFLNTVIAKNLTMDAKNKASIVGDIKSEDAIINITDSSTITLTGESEKVAYKSVDSPSTKISLKQPTQEEQKTAFLPTI